MLAIYNVNFDDINKRFDPNQQVVYECLLNAGFGKIAIAGIMGNIHAESSLILNGAVIKVPLVFASGYRLEVIILEAANSVSGSKTDIAIQAAFILEEGN